MTKPTYKRGCVVETSRSTSERQSVFNHSHAPGNAQLLRLGFATAALRGGIGIRKAALPLPARISQTG